MRTTISIPLTPRKNQKAKAMPIQRRRECDPLDDYPSQGLENTVVSHPDVRDDDDVCPEPEVSVAGADNVEHEKEAESPDASSGSTPDDLETSPDPHDDAETDGQSALRTDDKAVGPASKRDTVGNEGEVSNNVPSEGSCLPGKNIESSSPTAPEPSPEANEVVDDAQAGDAQDLSISNPIAPPQPAVQSQPIAPIPTPMGNAVPQAPQATFQLPSGADPRNRKFWNNFGLVNDIIVVQQPTVSSGSHTNVGGSAHSGSVYIAPQHAQTIPIGPGVPNGNVGGPANIGVQASQVNAPGHSQVTLPGTSFPILSIANYTEACNGPHDKIIEHLHGVLPAHSYMLPYLLNGSRVTPQYQAVLSHGIYEYGIQLSLIRHIQNNAAIRAMITSPNFSIRIGFLTMNQEVVLRAIAQNLSSSDAPVELHPCGWRLPGVNNWCPTLVPLNDEAVKLHMQLHHPEVRVWSDEKDMCKWGRVHACKWPKVLGRNVVQHGLKNHLGPDAKYP
ncbi:hypothetical protein NMY22_g18109 [Coprinellus aureogranulatus]|nr:hypothetical protein NMY22_g18109 [Coprinellus aureogranulatus]